MSGFFDRQRKKQDVEFAFDQFIGQRLRLRLAHVEFEIGIFLFEQRQQRRQQVGRDRRDDAEAQRARKNAVRRAGRSR